MRRAVLAALVALVAVGHGLFAAPEGRAVPQGSERAVRGVALGLFATDPEWDYGPMLRELAGRGATDVMVVVHLSQRDRFAADLALRSGEAPSEATLARTLRQARQEGLRIAVMPIVHLRARAPGDWRGTITPADGLDAWFARYTALLLPLAALAEREGASRFVIGSELSSLEPYAARWRALAAAVRARFSGTLTYSANWDRLDGVGFWDAVDEIGVTGYFPLAEDEATPDAAGIARAWAEPRAEIAALARRHGRSVILTEVGYPSRRGAARRPWDDAGAGAVDLEGQRALYAGFCEAFADAAVIDGFYAWNWFGFGGPRDAGFSLRGKPAAAELEACFARRWRARTPQFSLQDARAAIENATAATEGARRGSSPRPSPAGPGSGTMTIESEVQR